MLKPSPPRRVNNPVDRVSVETWNRMVTCIEWLLKHLTPDNRTIYFDGTGQLTAKQSAAESYGSVPLKPKWWIPTIKTRDGHDYVEITNPGRLEAFGSTYNPAAGEVMLPDLDVGASVAIFASFFYENTDTPIVYLTAQEWADLFPGRGGGHPAVVLFTVRRGVNRYEITFGNICYTGMGVLNEENAEGYIWGFIPWMEGNIRYYKSTGHYVAAPGGAVENSILVPEDDFYDASMYIYITGGQYRAYLSLGLPDLPDDQPYAYYQLSNSPRQPRNWRFYLDWLLY